MTSLPQMYPKNAPVISSVKAMIALSRKRRIPECTGIRPGPLLTVLTTERGEDLGAGQRWRSE